MKLIFLCDSIDDFHHVYEKRTVEKISGNYNEKCYNKSDVLKNPDFFKDTEYLFSTWGMPEFSEYEIRTYFPNLKCVFYAAGSVQEFARPFLKCGVKVFSAWAANAVPVAEYTVAQIILANKGFYATSFLSKNKKHKISKDLSGKYLGNYGAKVGIVGAGMIGKLVIQMLKAYNLEVVTYDPFLPDDIAKKLGVAKVSLKELFSTCNVISNHLANNEQTKNIFDYELFSSMLPYSTFINTGRGAQVIEDDLIKCLENRSDITAVLDVTMPEPPADDSKFFTLDNCILTPHIAGSWGDEVHRMAEYMVEEFKCFKDGKSCKYEVTSQMLKTMA